MTNISRPKLIIFDWDNTLVDSWDIIHDSMMATFDRLRIKRQWESKAETQANGQHSLRDSFPKIFGCQFMRARDVYYEEYINRHLRELKPLADAAATLSALSAQQITMAVVSNKNHPVLLAEVAHVGWEKIFSAVVGAGHVARDKPDPAPFNAVMEKIYGAGEVDAREIGASKVGAGEVNAGKIGAGDWPKNWPARDQIWYVGDMNVDVTFARAIGVVSIMIPIEPLKQPADRELKSLGELVGLAG